MFDADEKKAGPQMSLTVADSRRERPTTMPTAGRGGAGVPRRVAFWLLALVFAATMLGTTLPTPLYVIYQARSTRRGGISPRPW